MISADEARQLDGLALGASSVSPAATASGLRRTRIRGSGIEFQEFRRYQPGDDPRTIDWTVEARLQQLVVRVSRADGHLRLHLLVDISGSMIAGAPGKIATARKLAAALCYVAIERRDEVGVATFDDTIRAHVEPASGRPQLFRVFETLRAATAGGRSRIDRALIDYGTAARGRGLVVVLSDFFEASGALEGLRFLLYRGFVPAVVQILAPEEVRPEVEEEIELTDLENPSHPPLVVDAGALASYKENLGRECAALGDFCASHGLPWVQVESSDSFEGLLHACRRAGLVARYG
jgi:uncharacterized protein (DUF58 family)